MGESESSKETQFTSQIIAVRSSFPKQKTLRLW